MAANVRCVDCGYLSRRVRAQGISRSHEGYYEAEPDFRENPLAVFNLVPGESNSWMRGELTCYRHAANLPLEIAGVRTRLPKPDSADSDFAGGPAAREVLYRERQCSRFFRYEPGVSPPDHRQDQNAAALEEDRRRFERSLGDFQQGIAERDSRQNQYLAWLAIKVAIALGLLQLLVDGMSMPPDAQGAWFGHWVVVITNAVKDWLLSLR